ncbi:MAG TPA: HD domain-containing protein [Candidatus Omnitrophota bacterium]|nr:HD domain-containing protein [Candidatus Omnitrophota bacterium]
MGKDSFFSVRMYEKNRKWENAIKRQHSLYSRDPEIRSEFARDYNRILHCTAFRRLKHKTQVFFATKNDHICTRIEHVNHVVAVSYTIANFLGLNTELTNAIALGHDLGHAPFGHAGEEVLEEITKDKLSAKFWHERNSLRFADQIEILPDQNDVFQNLLLTYAVRDGILLHCGEDRGNTIYPREQAIDLATIQEKGLFTPFTWEGCVVKISDRIAYIGRDIEDAVRLDILRKQQLKELKAIVNDIVGKKEKIREISNTALMHGFIIDLCRASSPENGIRFTEKYSKVMTSLTEYNYRNIYSSERLQAYKKYAKLVIELVFEVLMRAYAQRDSYESIKKSLKVYPILQRNFLAWIKGRSDLRSWPMSYPKFRSLGNKYNNEILYVLADKGSYTQSVIDFIAGMTDNFAIEIFNEITSFR